MVEPRGKLSSGTVLYRLVSKGEEAAGVVEVLLVHPAGNYNRRAPWGIPKGQPNPGEAMEEAARRETMEETGVICGDLVDIGFVDYTRSKKRVYAFVGRAPQDAAPHCASWEVDKAEFIDITRARRIIHPDQAVLIDRMLGVLQGDPSTADEHVLALLATLK
ncbi:MAG TPA: NUDIX hydrolase [Kofleriaceae bacterium]|jgi:predicted NUDIX family NTP pyrophosphohydrolase|nr:NUDIX hydrolase [Kofleriaceae bacterium]